MIETLNILNLFSFNISWIDVVDIFLVAILFYQLYKLVRGTVAINIFIGILAIYFIWLLVDAIQMKQLSKIIGQFIDVGVIVIIIVFQQEIRRFLILLGTKSFSGRKFIFSRLSKGASKINKGEIKPIVQAAFHLTKTKTGALIILANKSDLSFYESTGDKIDAILSARMIENIFFKNSPLHDGAVIIDKGRIRSARCVLPVTEQDDLPAKYGMRHRAAVGITEVSDSIAIIVSEETGNVSYCKSGRIKDNITKDQLEEYITRAIQA